MTARRFVSRAPTLTVGALALSVFGVTLAASALDGCVPSGNAPPFDAGPPQTKVIADSPGALTAVFEADFDEFGDSSVWPEPTPMLTTLDASALLPEAGGSTTDAGVRLDASALLPDAEIALTVDAGPTYGLLGPDWTLARGTRAWRIEEGRLCGKGAQNHGVWLNKVLPVNARIEFDAISDSADGDLKAEVWGDGKSGATATSYNNATSYIAILGGWKNTYHVLARKNEHGKDRKEIKVDNDSDDPREHGVSVGQVYRFKIERNDGKTVRFSVNGIDLLTYTDPEPLAGIGHDHLGFNNYWDNIKSCYDNIKITPL